MSGIFEEVQMSGFSNIKRSNQKWDKDNKDRVRYLKSRSTARNFIKKRAETDDLQEFKALIATRETELKNRDPKK